MSIQTSHYKKNNQSIKLALFSVAILLLTFELAFLYNRYIINSRNINSVSSEKKSIGINKPGLEKALNKIGGKND
jgi:hypothetical protein